MFNFKKNLIDRNLTINGNPVSLKQPDTFIPNGKRVAKILDLESYGKAFDE
jgi:hypothetical protein